MVQVWRNDVLFTKKKLKSMALRVWPLWRQGCLRLPIIRRTLRFLIRPRIVCCLCEHSVISKSRGSALISPGQSHTGLRGELEDTSLSTQDNIRRDEFLPKSNQWESKADHNLPRSQIALFLLSLSLSSKTPHEFPQFLGGIARGQQKHSHSLTSPQKDG